MPATISSRTPEGSRRRCPICGKVSRVLPAIFPVLDAPCPRCGYLLWPCNSVISTVKAELAIPRQRTRRPALKRAFDRLALWAGRQSATLRGKVAHAAPSGPGVYDPWLDG